MRSQEVVDTVEEKLTETDRVKITERLPLHIRYRLEQEGYDVELREDSTYVS